MTQVPWSAHGEIVSIPPVPEAAADAAAAWAALHELLESLPDSERIALSDAANHLETRVRVETAARLLALASEALGFAVGGLVCRSTAVGRQDARGGIA